MLRLKLIVLNVFQVSIVFGLSMDQCEIGDFLFEKANIGVEIFYPFTPLFEKEENHPTIISCMSACKRYEKCWALTYHHDTKKCRMRNNNRNWILTRYRIVPKVDYFEKIGCGWFKDRLKFISIVQDASDCKDIYNKGWHIDGNYGISVSGNPTVYQSIHCKMSLLGGGWTLILSQLFYSSFDKIWGQYKAGFGSLGGSFWYGNDMIHNLTKPGTDNEVLFILKSDNDQFYYPYYDGFNVGDEDSNYQLSVGTYKHVYGEPLPDRPSNVPRPSGDDFSDLDGMEFSTKNHDNDQLPYQECQTDFVGAGWWYKDCGSVVLTGKLGGKAVPGPRWKQITGENDSAKLKSVQMLVRKKSN